MQSVSRKWLDWRLQLNALSTLSSAQPALSLIRRGPPLVVASISLTPAHPCPARPVCYMADLASIAWDLVQPTSPVCPSRQPLSVVAMTRFPVAASIVWEFLAYSTPVFTISLHFSATARPPIRTFLFQQSFPDIVIWHLCTVIPWTSYWLYAALSQFKYIDLIYTVYWLTVWHQHYYMTRVFLESLYSDTHPYQWISPPPI